MYEYYLQKGDSTSAILRLDKVADLDLDLPQSDFKLINNMGDGAQIQGVGNLSGRKMSCSYQFRGNSIFERDEFLDWFTQNINSTYYLYRITKHRIKGNLTGSSSYFIPSSTEYFTQISNLLILSDLSITNGTIGITNGTKITTVSSSKYVLDAVATMTLVGTDVEVTINTLRIVVYPALSGGETWKSYRLSDDVKFLLFSKTPYFTSTTLFETSISITSTAEQTTSVNIVSLKTPCLYEFDNSTTLNLFQVKTYDGYGFRVSYSVTTGSSNILIDTRDSDLLLYENGNQLTSNYFSNTSTPFPLESGDNTIYITAAEGTLKVQYYERRL